MVTVETKKIKLDKIKTNADNPRTISKKAMANLIKSLTDFPDMLELREIVVDETMTVLGGNMRLLAMKKMSAKDCPVKIVTGLTPDQKREFIIKDNGSFGEWDMDALSSLDDLPLTSWGIDLPESWTAQTEPEQTGAIKNNFTSNYGGSSDDDEEEDNTERGVDGKYPVTFILDRKEYEKWERIKETLKVKSDKAAMQKIIGGAKC